MKFLVVFLIAVCFLMPLSAYDKPVDALLYAVYLNTALLITGAGLIFVWFIQEQTTPEKKLFGAVIDTWSFFHIFGPPALFLSLGLIMPSAVAGIIAAACVVLWEVWDVFKLKRLPEEAGSWSQAKVKMYSSIFVSEGKFDIADAIFGLATLCFVYAWS